MWGDRVFITSPSKPEPTPEPLTDQLLKQMHSHKNHAKPEKVIVAVGAAGVVAVADAMP